MNLGTLQPILRALLASLSGLVCVEEDQAQPYIDPVKRAIVRLKITPIESRGTEDERYALIPLAVAPVDYQATYHGIRLINLRIKVASFDQRDGLDAYHYAEKIRDGLAWRSTLATLRAADCAVTTRRGTIDIPGKKDDRIVSVAVLEVRLAVANLSADPVPTTYIATVELVPEVTT